MHDGYSGSTYNPVMRTLDRAKVDALWDAANPLSLGFWFTNETKYLTKAASLFRTFFLDPETRMNPNLEYAVTEPGCKVCNDGTNDPAKCGWGGTVQLARIRYALSCISLLEAGDPNGAVWTAADRHGMRAWVSNMTDWWLHSYLGRSAHARQNNIGLAYSVCAIAMALYSDQPNQATALAKVRAYLRLDLICFLCSASLRPGVNVSRRCMSCANPVPGGLRQADAPRHLAQQITPKGLLPNEDAPHDLFSFGCVWHFFRFV